MGVNQGENSKLEGQVRKNASNIVTPITNECAKEMIYLIKYVC